MRNYNFDTTQERLRAARDYANSARNHVYVIDEGRTSGGEFKCNLSDDHAGYYGMHPRIRELLAALDDVMRLTADMQDELNA